MSSSKNLKSPQKVLGVGLSCLDIIEHGKYLDYYNGGSCGNVIAVLSFLGFSSNLITRRYNDVAGNVLKANLAQLGINSIEVGKNPTQTPRIIEKLIHEDGAYVGHKFLMECPECSQPLPKLKLLSQSDVKPVINSSISYNALYADRISPGISLLIDAFNGNGAWTIYEPNSCRNAKAFFNNASKAKILKFSSEKVPLSVAEKIRCSTERSQTLIIIQTLGKEGLRFSYRKKSGLFSQWIRLPAQPILNLVDTTGAGDWCTAGMISCLLSYYDKSPQWIKKTNVISALQYGQALSAIACSFVGGQGLIYANKSKDILSQIFSDDNPPSLDTISPVIPDKKMVNVCHTCLQSRYTLDG